MNSELEDRLTDSMRHMVGGMELGGEVLARATRRHRRRAVFVRTGYGLGVAGLAGALAAGLLQGGGGPVPGTGHTPAVQALPAAVRLANAAAASDNISYRMRMQTGTAELVLSTFEGAFDPRTDTGYCRSPRKDSVLTELLIDGTRYVGGERPPGYQPTGESETYGRYGEYPGKFDRLSIYAEQDPVLGAAAPDPAALFQALRDANAATSEKPDGTLHFEYTIQDPHGSRAISGDVTLNADGRIARVITVLHWQTTAKGRLDQGTVHTTLELFDYGVEVTVQRPADVVPHK